MAFKGPNNYLFMDDSSGYFSLDDSDMSLSGDDYQITNIWDPLPHGSDYFGHSLAVTAGNIFLGKTGANTSVLTTKHTGQSVIMYDHSGAYGDSADGQALLFGAFRNQFRQNMSDTEPDRGHADAIDAADGLLAIATEYRTSSTIWNDPGNHCIEVFNTQTGALKWGLRKNDLGATDYTVLYNFGKEHAVAIGSGRVVLGWDNSASPQSTNEGRVSILDYEGEQVVDGFLRPHPNAAYPGENYVQRGDMGFGYSVFIKHGRIFVIADHDTTYQNSSSTNPFVSIFDLDGNFINAITSEDLYGSNVNLSGLQGPQVRIACGKIVICRPDSSNADIFFATLDGFVYRKIPNSSYNQTLFHPFWIAGGKMFFLNGSSGSERIAVTDMNHNHLYTIQHSEIENIAGSSYGGGITKIKGFGNTIVFAATADDHSGLTNNGSAWMLKSKTDNDTIWENILERIY